MVDVVLFGATGFVGSRILPELLTCNWVDNVYLLLRNPEKLDKLNNPKLILIKGELENIPESLIPKQTKHIIMHFATKQIDPDLSGYAINMQNLKNIISACNANTLGFIYASSMSVYGQTEQINILETAKLNPQTELAISRVNCEEILAREMTSKNIPYIIFRPRFILDELDINTLPQWEKLVMKGIYFGSGAQKYSLISTKDYAIIAVQMAHKLLNTINPANELSGAYNLAYAKPISYDEIFNVIKKYCKIKKQRKKTIPINKLLFIILSFIPGKQIIQLLTRLELMGLSHNASVDKISKIVGMNIIGKSPVQVLTDIIIKKNQEINI